MKFQSKYNTLHSWKCINTSENIVCQMAVTYSRGDELTVVLLQNASWMFTFIYIPIQWYRLRRCQKNKIHPRPHSLIGWVWCVCYKHISKSAFWWHMWKDPIVLPAMVDLVTWIVCSCHSSGGRGVTSSNEIPIVFDRFPTWTSERRTSTATQRMRITYFSW